MLAPDFPPEPPRIQPALEIHRPAPARDPEPIFWLISDVGDAFSRLHSSALVSVIAGDLDSTAASVPREGAAALAARYDEDAGEALRRAVEVIEWQFRRRQ